MEKRKQLNDNARAEDNNREPGIKEEEVLKDLNTEKFVSTGIGVKSKLSMLIGLAYLVYEVL